MNCDNPSSHKVVAWVDGALSAQDARDVACHVATCGICHDKAKKLRAENEALRHALGQVRAPSHLWPQISNRLAAEPVPQTRWTDLRTRFRRSTRPIVAAALAASLLGGVVLFQQTPGWRIDTDHHLQVLAVETVQDYMTFRISQRELDVVSDDPTDTLLWLGARTGGSVPDMTDHVLDYRMIGGRLCWLMGQRLGALTYAKGDDQITVYVIPAPSGSTNGRVHRDGDAQVRHAAGPIRSTVWVESGLLIAVVSDLADAEKDRFAAALRRSLSGFELEI